MGLVSQQSLNVRTHALAVDGLATLEVGGLITGCTDDTENAGVVHLSVFMMAVSSGAIMAGLPVDRFGLTDTFAVEVLSRLSRVALIAAGKPLQSHSVALLETNSTRD